MREETFTSIVPGQVLSIEELSNIRGGDTDRPVKDEGRYACNTGACSSSIETMRGFCNTAVCNTGA